MNLDDLIPELGRLAFLPHLRDLAIAYAMAFIVGWNREREDRSAGLRTFPLVAIASCGIILALDEPMRADPQASARVVEGVITGIGFVGAGAILKGGNEVHGMATAASIWATGVMGVAVGLNNYDVAMLICLFMSVTLYLMSRFKPDGPRAGG